MLRTLLCFECLAPHAVFRLCAVHEEGDGKLQLLSKRDRSIRPEKFHQLILSLPPKRKRLPQHALAFSAELGDASAFVLLRRFYDHQTAFLKRLEVAGEGRRIHRKQVMQARHRLACRSRAGDASQQGELRSLYPQWPKCFVEVARHDACQATRPEAEAFGADDVSDFRRFHGDTCIRNYSAADKGQRRFEGAASRPSRW
jgi:hypothetical protein